MPLWSSFFLEVWRAHIGMINEVETLRGKNSSEIQNKYHCVLCFGYNCFPPWYCVYPRRQTLRGKSASLSMYIFTCKVQVYIKLHWNGSLSPCVVLSAMTSCELMVESRCRLVREFLQILLCNCGSTCGSFSFSFARQARWSLQKSTKEQVLEHCSTISLRNIQSRLSSSCGHYVNMHAHSMQRKR